MDDFAENVTIIEDLRKESGTSKDDIPCNHVQGDKRRMVKR